MARLINYLAEHIPVMHAEELEALRKENAELRANQITEEQKQDLERLSVIAEKIVGIHDICSAYTLWSIELPCVIGGTFRDELDAHIAESKKPKLISKQQVHNAVDSGDLEMIKQYVAELEAKP